MEAGAGQAQAHLLRRLASGDEEAFASVYRAHAPRLYRYALHMTGQVAAAEEVLQETFMVLLERADQLDPNRGTVEQFLFGVARNRIRRWLQQDGRYVELPEERSGEPPARPFPLVSPGEGDILESLTRDQLTQRLWQTIQTLPEHYREVLVLCELEGLEYSEAAAALGCPVGTVRSRLHRARELLAERMRSLTGLASSVGPEQGGE
jgi:RNA polymerase sigma-70 factor (ECF subfamily)